MTLSRLVRDYIYIPMGGSRHGELNTARAGLTAMLLCGLWHGAGWTFVAWGGMHGLGIIVQRQWDRTGVKLPRPFAWALTLLFVILGWVLFRAQDFGSAWQIVVAMAGANDWGSMVARERWQLIVLGFMIALVGPTAVEIANRVWIVRPAVAVTTAIVLVVLAMRVGYGRSIDFIYFQF